jgi:DNA-binding LacI/PurR family transcriptional regulator
MNTCAMISIKDIARAANVSHSTVSRALRNSPLVNPQTIQRIRAVADEKGYRVSAVGRSLVNRRTDTIGLVVTSIADPFNAEIVSGIEEIALTHGYSLLLATCHSDPNREMLAVQSFYERRVDGILVSSSRVGSLYRPLLSDMEVPVVFINSHHPDEGMYSISIDNFNAAFEATQHLLDLGHMTIAYLGNQFGLQADMQRFAGYRSALEQVDVGFNPELVVHGNGGPENARLVTGRLLSLSCPPTALFCFNDMSAYGAIRAAREHGLSIPSDLSVVGLDDLLLSAYIEPPLTTVRQPKHQMGRLAAETLVQLLSGKTPEKFVSVRGELIVRNSTARVASALGT